MIFENGAAMDNVVSFKAHLDKKIGDDLARLINYILAYGGEVVATPIANQNREPPHGY